MAVMQKKNNKNLTVFFDFDNTITTFDIIDDINFPAVEIKDFLIEDVVS